MLKNEDLEALIFGLVISCVLVLGTWTLVSYLTNTNKVPRFKTWFKISVEKVEEVQNGQR